MNNWIVQIIWAVALACIVVGCGSRKTENFVPTNWTQKFLSLSSGEFRDGSGHQYFIESDGGFYKKSVSVQTVTVSVGENGDAKVIPFKRFSRASDEALEGQDDEVLRKEFKVQCSTVVTGEIQLVEKVLEVNSQVKVSKKIQKALSISPSAKYLISGFLRTEVTNIDWLNGKASLGLEGVKIQKLGRQIKDVCQSREMALSEPRFFRWAVVGFGPDMIHILSQTILGRSQKSTYENPLFDLDAKILVSSRRKSVDVFESLLPLLNGRYHASRVITAQWSSPALMGDFGVTFLRKKERMDVLYSVINPKAINGKCTLNYSGKIEKVLYSPDNGVDSKIIIMVRPNKPGKTLNACASKGDPAEGKMSILDRAYEKDDVLYFSLRVKASAKGASAIAVGKYSKNSDDKLELDLQLGEFFRKK